MLDLGSIERRLSMVEACLATLDAAPWRAQPDLPLAEIVVEAAFQVGVTVAGVLSDNRAKPLVRARFAAAWAARHALGYSHARIGAGLGRRDHTTILGALRRAEQMREKDPAFRRLTDRLLAAAEARKAAA
jgi:chromosomal replication initiation ATPase DnaA